MKYHCKTESRPTRRQPGNPNPPATLSRLCAPALVRWLKRGLCLGLILGSWAVQAQKVDLLEKYPTTLTQGDTARDRARAWSFTAADLFELTKFSFKVEDKLKIELGASDVGIGHCSDGAVWAVVIPRDSGKLTSPAASDVEPVAHVWLRFHPGELSRLFPPATVPGRSPSNLVAQVRAVANAKMRSSWQAGGRAMIPAPSELTVDVDTKTGVRRFYGVDTKAKKAEYVSAFEGKPVARPNQ